MMKVESDIVLTCSVCRAESPHKLLYLSQRLRASECMNCGTTRIYSGHIYAEYARDLTERVAWLPRSAWPARPSGARRRCFCGLPKPFASSSNSRTR